ncbi:hypothetical protein [Deinococcus petrolearius]|uniref:Uncharacterized protein n=1 Tax=Deinococcus petrolearius TaxID=1751295 RepID=A0ABW1DNE6_9DEIO
MNLIQKSLESVRVQGFTVINGFVGGQKAVEVDVEFEEFLNLPAAAVPVVFANVVSFDEDDLKYRIEDPRSPIERFREGEMLPEIVDLLKVKPDLARFQPHLDTPAFVAFAAPLNGVLVKSFVTEPWYNEMSALISEAEALAEEQAFRRREAKKAKEAAKLEDEVQKIRSLTEDADFVRLAKLKSTAQRTLMSLAKQKYPEATTAVGDQRLKELMAEIQDLILTR